MPGVPRQARRALRIPKHRKADIQSQVATDPLNRNRRRVDSPPKSTMGVNPMPDILQSIPESSILSSTDEGIEQGDELHDEECPCPKCKLYRWRIETRSEPGTVPPDCEGADCQGCHFCPDVPLSDILILGQPLEQYNGVQPDDLNKHTSSCLDRSWTLYEQSPLDRHVCVCDGRGDGMEWDDLDRERRLVGQQEVEVRQERIAREREKWQAYDNPEEAEAKAESTLDDLTAVFDDEVDLTPTPAILDRRHGDRAMVIPAGKLSWLYGLPASGKSFIGLIGVSEAVLQGGRVMFLDYEDNKTTFQQRAAILGLNPKNYADSFRYIHGGLADSPLATAQAQEWLSQADSVEMSLVVIDAAESSGCPSDGASVNEWLAKVIAPWLSPNPPKDTDGRREESGRGGEGATGEIAWVPFGVGRSADGLHRRTGAPMAVCGSCDARDGERIRSRELSRTGLARVCGDLRLSGGWVADGAVRPGVEWLAAGPRRG